LGNHFKAIPLLRKSVYLCPSFLIANYDLVLALISIGDLNTAVHYYELLKQQALQAKLQLESIPEFRALEEQLIKK
jgi:hypothetical protein